MWPQTIWRSAFQNLTWIEKKRKIEFPKVSLLRRTKCYQNLVLAQFRNRETLYLITANFEVASKISNWKSFSQKKWWIGGRICRWDQMVFFFFLYWFTSVLSFSLACVSMVRLGLNVFWVEWLEMVTDAPVFVLLKRTNQGWTKKRLTEKSDYTDGQTLTGLLL